MKVVYWVIGVWLGLASIGWGKSAVLLEHPIHGPVSAEKFFELSLERIKAAPTSVERREWAFDFSERIRLTSQLFESQPELQKKLNLLADDVHQAVRDIESERASVQSWAARLGERFSHFVRGSLRLLSSVGLQSVSAVLVAFVGLDAVSALDIAPSLEFKLIVGSVGSAPVVSYIIKREFGSWITRKFTKRPANTLSMRLACRELLGAIWLN